MNLRRLSAMVDRDKLLRPERMEPPRSSGKKRNGLVMLSRQGTSFQPMRLRMNNGSDIKPIQPLGHSLSGPTPQLFPTPRTKTNTADDLDGIAVLPSTSRAEHGGSKASKGSTSTSIPRSRIPKSSGSKGTTSESTKIKRRSFVVAKKRLSMSKKQTERRPTDRRLESPARPTRVSSRLSSESTTEFEADELAAALPTPGPLFKRPSVPSCPCKCTESLQEIRVLHKEMVTFQKESLVKQTKIMDRQNELIQKQMDVLIKLNTLLDKNINFFNNSVNINEEDMQLTNDKENHFGDGNQSVIGERAATLYNGMRSDFNFLRLKTPAKSAGASAVSPKTPKSLLSRTLQMQLGDIFEES